MDNTDEFRFMEYINGRVPVESTQINAMPYNQILFGGHFNRPIDSTRMDRVYKKSNEEKIGLANITRLRTITEYLEQDQSSESNQSLEPNQYLNLWSQSKTRMVQRYLNNQYNKKISILEKIEESDNQCAKNFVNAFKEYFQNCNSTLVWLSDSEIFESLAMSNESENISEMKLTDCIDQKFLMKKEFASTILIALKTIEIEDYWSTAHYDFDSLNCIMNSFNQIDPFITRRLRKYVFNIICIYQKKKNNIYMSDLMNQTQTQTQTQNQTQTQTQTQEQEQMSKQEKLAQLEKLMKLDKISESEQIEYIRHIDLIYSIIMDEFANMVDSSEIDLLVNLMKLDSIKGIIIYILFLYAIFHEKKNLFGLSGIRSYPTDLALVNFSSNLAISNYTLFDKDFGFGIIFERFRKMNIFFVEKASECNMHSYFCLKNIIFNDDPIGFELMITSPNFTNFQYEFNKCIKTLETPNIAVINVYLKYKPIYPDLIENSLNNIFLISHLLKKKISLEEQLNNFICLMKSISFQPKVGIPILIHIGKNPKLNLIELVDIVEVKEWFLNLIIRTNYFDIEKITIYSEILEKKFIMTSVSYVDAQNKLFEFYKYCIEQRIIYGLGNSEKILIYWFLQKNPNIFDPTIVQKIKSQYNSFYNQDIYNLFN